MTDNYEYRWRKWFDGALEEMVREVAEASDDGTWAAGEWSRGPAIAPRPLCEVVPM